MSENHQGPAAVRRLPEHPNLEQLRKQAKELLEQFRAGDPAAVAEVWQFERSPDALHLPSAMRNESWRGPMAMRVGPS